MLPLGRSTNAVVRVALAPREQVSLEPELMAEVMKKLSEGTVVRTMGAMWADAYSMRSRLARLWRAQSNCTLAAVRDVPPLEKGRMWSK